MTSRPSPDPPSRRAATRGMASRGARVVARADLNAGVSGFALLDPPGARSGPLVASAVALAERRRGLDRHDDGLVVTCGIHQGAVPTGERGRASPWTTSRASTRAPPPDGSGSDPPRTSGGRPTTVVASFVSRLRPRAPPAARCVAAVTDARHPPRAPIGRPGPRTAPPSPSPTRRTGSAAGSGAVLLVAHGAKRLELFRAVLGVRDDDRAPTCYTSRRSAVGLGVAHPARRRVRRRREPMRPRRQNKGTSPSTDVRVGVDALDFEAEEETTAKQSPRGANTNSASSDRRRAATTTPCSKAPNETRRRTKPSATPAARVRPRGRFVRRPDTSRTVLRRGGRFAVSARSRARLRRPREPRRRDRPRRQRDPRGGGRRRGTRTRPRARGGMLGRRSRDAEGAGGGGFGGGGKEGGNGEAAALVSLAAAGPWIVAADAAGDAWAWDASARGERFEREVRENETGGARPLRGAGIRARSPPPPFAASDAAPVRRSSGEKTARPGRRPFANASTVSSDARRGRARRPPRVGATRHFFVPVLRRKEKSNGRGLGSMVFSPRAVQGGAAGGGGRRASVEVRRAIASSGASRDARGGARSLARLELRAAVALARAANGDDVGTATAEPRSGASTSSPPSKPPRGTRRCAGWPSRSPRGFAAAADLVDPIEVAACFRGRPDFIWGSEAPKKTAAEAGRFERRGRGRSARETQVHWGTHAPPRTSRKSSPRRSGGGRRRRGGGTRGGRPRVHPNGVVAPPKIRLGSKNRFRASPAPPGREARRVPLLRDEPFVPLPPGTRVAPTGDASRASARRPARRAAEASLADDSAQMSPRRRGGHYCGARASPRARHHHRAERRGAALDEWAAIARGEAVEAPDLGPELGLGPPARARRAATEISERHFPGTVFRDGARGRRPRYPRGNDRHERVRRSCAGGELAHESRSGARRSRRGARRRRSRTGSGRSASFVFRRASSTGRVDFSEETAAETETETEAETETETESPQYRPREPRRARGETRPLDPRRGRGFGRGRPRGAPFPARRRWNELRLLRAGGAVSARRRAPRAPRRAGRRGAARPGRTPSSRARSSRRRSGNSRGGRIWIEARADVAEETEMDFAVDFAGVSSSDVVASARTRP